MALEPQFDAQGNPAVEKLPDDAAVVRSKLTGSDDAEFMKMMGLKKAGEQVEEGTEGTAEEQPEEQKEIAEEVSESREDRRAKADAAKRGHKEVPKEEAVEEVVEAPAGEEEVAEEAKAEEAGEAKPLLTQFTLKQDGNETEIPRDVTLDFKGNGKEYKDMPLDKVVLLAQMGLYNEAREQEVQLAKKYVSETSQNMKHAETLIEGLKKEFNDLLSDETYYEVARQEFLKNNSPEERARRAEESLQQQRQVERVQEQKRQGQAYIQTNILPAVERILQTFPSVSEDEVMGRFNRLITPYLENGVVPINSLPAVKQLVEQEMNNWAQSITAERDTARKQQEEKVQKIVKTEKVKTTLAKRELARTLKPQGTLANVKETKKSKQYKSADDWANSAVNDILTDALGRQ